MTDPPTADNPRSRAREGVDLVASWNFKHIVHYDKIAGYNAVNLLNGYRPVQIFSPKEIVEP